MYSTCPDRRYVSSSSSEGSMCFVQNVYLSVRETNRCERKQRASGKEPECDGISSKVREHLK
jgi:hypothetical protein